MFIYLIKSLPCCFLLAGLNFTYLLSKLEYSQLSLLDCVNRANLDLPNWDYLYVMWTNFDYIYLYFLPFIWLFILNCNLPYYNSFNLKKLAYAVITILLLQSLTPAGLSQALAYKSVDLSNSLLVNSVNKYHPAILHTCLNLVILYFLKSPTTKLILRAPHVNLYVFGNASLVTFLIILTMFMGSWWAYQEGSWGGWWAWDPSEVFGLVLMISWVYALHVNFAKSRLTGTTSVTRAIFYANLLVYVILQSNFSITSHNFGLRDESSLITKLVFYFILVITLKTLFSNNRLNLAMSKYFNSSKTSKHWHHKGLYLICAVVITTILGLLPLVTDLLWKVFSINLVNFTADYTFLLWLIALVVLISTSHLSLSTITSAAILALVVLYCGFSSFCLLVFYLALLSLTLFSRLHTLVIALVVVSSISSSYGVSLNLLSDSVLLSNSGSTIKSYYDLVVTTQYSSEAVLTSTSGYSNSTLGFSPVFTLLSSSYNYYQLFISNSSRVIYYNFSLDPLVSSIASGYFLFSLLFLQLLKQKQIIKC